MRPSAQSLVPVALACFATPLFGQATLLQPPKVKPQITSSRFLSPTSLGPRWSALGVYDSTGRVFYALPFRPEAARCPMPVSVPDSLAARPMPQARHDTTTVERMPVAREWCSNPLGPRPH